MSEARLIITADDFGYSCARNKGIVKAFTDGLMTRSSLLVNGKRVKDAAQKAAEFHIPLGLHLNLTEGTPLSDPTCILSVLDQYGHFMGRFTLQEAVVNNQVSMDQVAMEMSCQIEEFERLTGHTPLYVDGHQHVHIYEGIAEVFARVLTKHNISETRLPIEEGVYQAYWLPANRKPFLEYTHERSIEAKKVFDSHGLCYTAHFIGLTVMGRNMTVDRLKLLLQDARRSASCEVMTHVGYRTDPEQVDPALEGCGNGSDDFDQSPDREYELELMCGQELRDIVKSMNWLCTSTL